MGPRADFCCRSPQCRTEDGEATVYELPVGAIRCPVCGSKKLTRLYNKIAVLRGAQPPGDPRLTSSSHLVRSTAALQPGFDAADAAKPPDDMKSFGVPATTVTGMEQGTARLMTEMEIHRAVRQDPYHIASILRQQARHTLPVRALTAPA